MGHVMRELPENEITITLLAAGMDPADSQPPIRNSEVFYTPKSAPVSRGAVQVAEPQQQTAQVVMPPIQLDEIDLDLPSFLRRQREPE